MPDLLRYVLSPWMPSWLGFGWAKQLAVQQSSRDAAHRITQAVSMLPAEALTGVKPLLLSLSHR